MKLLGNLVAATGKYQDRNTGAEKTSYTRMGKAFQKDDGSITLKIDSMPVSPEWTGWVSVFPDDKQQQSGQQSTQPIQQPADDMDIGF